MLNIIVIVSCFIVLGLGAAHLIRSDNPLERAASEIIQFETGLDIELPSEKNASPPPP